MVCYIFKSIDKNDFDRTSKWLLTYSYDDIMLYPTWMGNDIDQIQSKPVRWSNFFITSITLHFSASTYKLSAK